MQGKTSLLQGCSSPTTSVLGLELQTASASSLFLARVVDLFRGMPLISCLGASN